MVSLIIRLVVLQEITPSINPVQETGLTMALPRTSTEKRERNPPERMKEAYGHYALTDEGKRNIEEE